MSRKAMMRLSQPTFIHMTTKHTAEMWSCSTKLVNFWCGRVLPLKLHCLLVILLVLATICFYWILWRPYQTTIVHLFEVEKVSSHWCGILCGFSEKTFHILLLLYVYRLLYWNFLKLSSWNIILIWCGLWWNVQNPTIT